MCDPNAKQFEMIRAEWFREHTAVRSQEGLMVRIHWSKPRTSNYAIDYIFFRNRLIVCGDCGEAVYVWSERITPEFVAGCDLGYFASKCEAAGPEVRRGKRWQSEKAKAWMLGFIQDKIRELVREGSSEADATRTVNQQVEELDLNWEEHTGSEYEWGRFMHENYEFFGDDPPYGCGMDYDLHIAAHLIGLQMALVELQKHAGAASQG